MVVDPAPLKIAPDVDDLKLRARRQQRRKVESQVPTESMSGVFGEENATSGDY